MKTYVLILSKKFPATHKRAGKKTDFADSLFDTKIHTIRSNFKLWNDRIADVNNGKAVISIRQWSGKPYRSKQETICELNRESGIGVQCLWFHDSDIFKPHVAGYFNIQPRLIDLANNDGLCLDDFYNWFKDYDLSKQMAIIQFTAFRYNKQ